MRITAFGITDKGRQRPNNEDDLAVVDLTAGTTFEDASVRDLPVGDPGVLLAVCDGVGGRRAGEVASALALSRLAAEMETASDDCPRRALFGTAVERVNSAVWEKSHEDPRLEGMATTLTAAVVCGHRAVIAHVGDSRAYVLRGSAIRQVTRDQSFVQAMIASGALTEEDAAHSPFRNVILQAIGRKKKIDVALDAIELENGDGLFFCTDGLSEKVTSDEIAKALQGADLAAGVRSLVALANERGGEDNITALAARVSE
ncbi:MAG: protein phosphatase 2C domain-containing protein [Acidobacteriota bacterium]|nr:protein phosphatase 2C domain-containing protein [Acidobacteriota bacterium]